MSLRTMRCAALALTLMAGTVLPTGDDAFTNDEVVPEVKLALDLGLTPDLAFSAGAGCTFLPGGNLMDTFSTYASLGAAVPGTDGLDGVLTFLPDPTTQLDVNVGLGLSGNQPAVVVGAGVARRF